MKKFMMCMLMMSVLFCFGCNPATATALLRTEDKTETISYKPSRTGGSTFSKYRNRIEEGSTYGSTGGKLNVNYEMPVKITGIQCNDSSEDFTVGVQFKDRTTNSMQEALVESYAFFWFEDINYYAIVEKDTSSVTFKFSKKPLRDDIICCECKIPIPISPVKAIMHLRLRTDRRLCLIDKNGAEQTDIDLTVD
jgi:hypothetical protein